MKISTLATTLIWLVCVTFAVIFGLTTPRTAVLSTETGNIPIETVLVLTVGPFLFFAIAAFKQREKLVSNSMISNRIINKIFGDGAAVAYRSTLRPSLLFMTVLLVWGSTGLVATLMTTNAPNAFLLAGMMFSGGLGLLVAFFLSTKYPPRLV